ncbi:DUF4267 domain-containing protein [Chitinophaga sp. Cy-1792]|uniref:DUF4267 domain-containing protein n=1 Tax=Chitinophaga sp. Cy-1792 TaxID=2608339 RepID=UPI00141FED45|nr:DUF4267 domain-containing protein [Chitinophaga sp. Cy-1792]NIG55739.1 DUF4267 domain-containing protein [Chitinophaga sp. Cy-1792]
MKTITQKTAWFLSLATGLLLMFIGLRFFLVPEQAEAGFGIHTGLTEHFEFHYIKGIRDFAFGLLTTVLLLNKEYRSLGWLMLCCAIIPTTDFIVVLSNPLHPAAAIYPHLTAVLICLTVGPYYLYTTRKSQSYAV